MAAPTGTGSTPAPVLKKKAGQKWWDWAGEQAREADALEKKGLMGEAEQTRERVLTALLLAWREERELRALEPIVITLQRRLGRSTAAIETALSLIYDIHQADKLSPEQEAQIGKLSTQVSLALRRLRREAKPGAVALCQEPMALRPGVLTLAGPLPGDEVLVLRDRADGGVEAVRCPARVEVAPAVAPAVACPACPEPPPPVVVRELVDHWWFTGPGLGLLAVGGVMLGLGIDAHLTASDLADELEFEATNDPDEAAEQRWNEGASIGWLTGGGVLIAVGIAGVVTGLVIAGDAEAGEPGVAVSAGPGGAAVTVSF
ncbi:MAG: hypothetical protein H6703_08655 [Myxococcales bacterium]|nr:hypothetical protein [Myxococcales bacterium]